MSHVHGTVDATTGEHMDRLANWIAALRPSCWRQSKRASAHLARTLKRVA